MFPRRPQEGSRSSAPSPPLPSAPLLLLPLLLLSAPPPSLADSPPLLSLLVPWEGGRAPGAALENLGEAPFDLSTPDDERRLQALLESDRVRLGGGGGPDGDEWESPKSPDLFLLTEMGGSEGRRRRDATPPRHDEDANQHASSQSAAPRTKRNGGYVSNGGSRIRTGGTGGGFAGSSGMRVGSGFGGFNPGRLGPQMGGRMNEGPSLSIVNPLDVLRQRLLLEIARRRMRESEDQIQANRELLKSIGKRESGGGGGGDRRRTPSSI